MHSRFVILGAFSWAIVVTKRITFSRSIHSVMDCRNAVRIVPQIQLFGSEDNAVRIVPCRKCKRNLPNYEYRPAGGRGSGSALCRRRESEGAATNQGTERLRQGLPASPVNQNG